MSTFNAQNANAKRAARWPLGLLFALLLLPLAYRGLRTYVHPAAPSEELITGLPHLEFAERSHNLGTVPQEWKTEVKYAFQNSGGGRLRIEKIESSCGCVVVFAEKTELRPNERSAVVVRYRSGVPSGRQHAQIRVFSNDAQQPLVQLTLEAVVQPFLELRPGLIDCGEITAGKTHSFNLLTRSRSGQPFRFTRIQSDRPEVQVLTQTEHPSQTQHALRLEVRADLPRRTVSGAITLETDLPDNRSTKLPYLFHVQGVIRVRPSALFFLQQGPQPSREMKLELLSESQDFQLLKCETTDPAFQVRVETLRPQRHYQLYLSMQAEKSTLVKTATLIVRTDHPEESEMRVPLQGRWHEGKEK